MLRLSLPEARRLMIGSQLLSGPPPKRPTRARMLETIRQIGALQIDSISVVKRSHHLVLWSRLGNHPPEWLEEIHSTHRAIFEFWVHAAAYAPIELYGCFRHDMLRYNELASRQGLEWLAANRSLCDEVVAYVRENGPVTSQSFAPPDGAARPEPWAWYGNKPTNVALEVLWRTGELMVSRREKFQRVYDLPERVYPEWSDDQMPSIEETDLTLGRAALKALGITTVRWLPDYYRRRSTRNTVPGMMPQEILETLVETGDAVRAEVDGLPSPVYVAAEALQRTFRPSRTTLLSPFDNLVWHRLRTAELFGFDLVFEPYVPKEKRIYGYFTLTILHRDQLVGRVDAKAHRSTGELSINSLHLEPWFIGRDNERFYRELATTLHDFTRFNGTDHITVRATYPEDIRPKLLDALIGEERSLIRLV